MMMKKILLAALVFGAAGQYSALRAQNYQDVLRYSQKNVQGTGRTVGVGGAFGTLGADFSSLSINPAGLGLYRQQEVTFSLGLNKQSGTANYLGNTAADDKFNFNISNLGMVLSDVKTKLGKPVQDGWVAVNFGIGFNRTNNFNSNIAVEGINKSNGIAQSWAEQADGALPASLPNFSYASLAWKAYQIDQVDDDPNSTKYVSKLERFDSGYVNVFQSDYISTRGSMNDIALTLAGNYSNKLYLGAGFMFPTVGYHYSRIFTENNLNTDSKSDIKSAKLIENVNTSGIGFSLNAGFIYRLNDNIRVGGAVQIPTFYSLTDNYNYEMQTERLSGNYVEPVNTGPGRFKYSIVTPMRSTLSAAYIFGKSGFISADYEIINYSAGRINTEFEGARDQNNMVRTVYKNAGNLRIGAEYRWENFAFRGGYQLNRSPFKAEYVPAGYSGGGQIFSGGIGLRDGDYFLDLGYQYRFDRYFYLPYSIRNRAVEGADITSSRSNVVVTLGSKF
jgi:hypothetical protein